MRRRWRVLGLYDQRGMLRFAGHGSAECLAYAELFELADGSFSIEPLFTPKLNAETMAAASAGAAPTGSAAL